MTRNYFCGIYTLKNENVQGDYTTLPCKITANKCGKNVLSINSVELNTQQQPNNHYLNETYTITSYDKEEKHKLGQITFQSLYLNTNNSIVTANGTQEFVVLGKSGIYKNVRKIKILYDSVYRFIYFMEC
jgi:hypothetical protein